jgi:hypothetical protein
VLSRETDSVLETESVCFHSSLITIFLECDFIEGDIDGPVRADATAFIAVFAQEFRHDGTTVLNPDRRIRAHLDTKGLSDSPAHLAFFHIDLSRHILRSYV